MGMIVDAGSSAEVTGMIWRKLNDEEKAAYGPHSMVVGFAECCPYCRTKDVAVVSDSKDPDSPYVYLENHEPHHDDKKEGHLLCPASESSVSDINGWMCGETDNIVAIHVAQMSYAEFVALRFLGTTVS